MRANNAATAFHIDANRYQTVKDYKSDTKFHCKWGSKFQILPNMVPSDSIGKNVYTTNNNNNEGTKGKTYALI